MWHQHGASFLYKPSLDLCTETLRASLMLCALGGVQLRVAGFARCVFLLPCPATNSFIYQRGGGLGWWIKTLNLGFGAGANTSFM